MWIIYILPLKCVEIIEMLYSLLQKYCFVSSVNVISFQWQPLLQERVHYLKKLRNDFWQDDKFAMFPACGFELQLVVSPI